MSNDQNDFKPDWDQAEALRDSLLEHMAMIRADREAMKLALEAFGTCRKGELGQEFNPILISIAIAALRERLAT